MSPEVETTPRATKPELIKHHHHSLPGCENLIWIRGIDGYWHCTISPRVALQEFEREEQEWVRAMAGEGRG